MSPTTRLHGSCPVICNFRIMSVVHLRFFPCIVCYVHFIAGWYVLISSWFVYWRGIVCVLVTVDIFCSCIRWKLCDRKFFCLIDTRFFCATYIQVFLKIYFFFFFLRSTNIVFTAHEHYFRCEAPAVMHGSYIRRGWGLYSLKDVLEDISDSLVQASYCRQNVVLGAWV